MDTLLVKRAQKQDMDAFVQLIEKNKTSLYKVAEAYDPYYMKHLEIKYKDGTSYIVSDKAANVNNTGYVHGTGEGDYKVIFNRLVDIVQIEEIIVNDEKFPVQ